MIRKRLAPEEGLRKKFLAQFSRFGKKVNYKGYSETTVLLINIREAATNILVADHLWFAFTKGFEKIRLDEGVMLEFEARVKEYEKGYVNKKYKINKRKKDFRLSHPTRIRAVSVG